MRSLPLCAIAISLWSIAASASQTTPSATLSADLRARLQNGKFSPITSVRGLPLGVREELQKMWRTGTLDIAEPGADYQRTDVLVTPPLPFRRMITAGCTNDFYCLIYYERGGIAHTWHAMLFHWSPDSTRFEFGGAAPGGLKTAEEIREAMLSGQVKGSQAGPW